MIVGSGGAVTAVFDVVFTNQESNGFGGPRSVGELDGDKERRELMPDPPTTVTFNVRTSITQARLKGNSSERIMASPFDVFPRFPHAMTLLCHSFFLSSVFSPWTGIFPKEQKQPTLLVPQALTCSPAY